MFLKQLSQDTNLTADFFKKTQAITAQACGVSERTVSRVFCEAKNSSLHTSGCLVFRTPRKGYRRAKTVTELDDYRTDVVRRTVHELHDRGERPTARMVLNAVKQKTDYAGSENSIRRLLINLGFTYQKFNDGRGSFVERDDIVKLRCKALKDLCTFRENNDKRPVIYVHEITFTATETTKSVGNNQHYSITQAWCSGGGLIPSSTMVSHIGDIVSNNGRVTFEVFKQWFIQLLDGFKEPSIIVMDITSHYIASIDDCIPGNDYKKADIQEWLMDRHIQFDPSETVAELRLRIKASLPTCQNEYKLDRLALDKGHQLICFQLHHNLYNPIYLMWSQVKTQIASYKLVNVQSALAAVTISDWKQYVQQAEKTQHLDYKKEIPKDSILKLKTEVMLSDNDSDWSNEENENMKTETMSNNCYNNLIL